MLIYKDSGIAAQVGDAIDVYGAMMEIVELPKYVGDPLMVRIDDKAPIAVLAQDANLEWHNWDRLAEAILLEEIARENALSMPGIIIY